jgi:hypothetical protein
MSSRRAEVNPCCIYLACRRDVHAHQECGLEDIRHFPGRLLCDGRCAEAVRLVGDRHHGEDESDLVTAALCGERLIRKDQRLSNGPQLPSGIAVLDVQGKVRRPIP